MARTFTVRFDFGEPVVVDDNEDLEATIIGYAFHDQRTEALLSWAHNGDLKTAWIDTYRLSFPEWVISSTDTSTVPEPTALKVPQPTALDKAWARINALRDVPDKSDPEQVGYRRALDDALAVMTELGATDAVWRGSL